MLNTVECNSGFPLTKQGDSCEFVLGQENRNTTTYLVDRKRPCFSVDVYMNALHKLRAMYNVTKVASHTYIHTYKHLEPYMHTLTPQP